MARPASTTRLPSRANTTSGRDVATIAEGTRIRGKIVGEGNLEVYGHVEGEVTLDGELLVGKGAELRSNVRASNIRIDGDVEGSVVAEGGRVHVGNGARLVGSVASAQFSLEEGGEFAGQLEADFDVPSALDEAAFSSSPRRRR